MMKLMDFKNIIESLLKSKGLDFKFFKGDEGGEWYSAELKDGLLEVYIVSDGEVGINLPSENDQISFGGCDEAYDDCEQALNRLREIIV